MSNKVNSEDVSFGVYVMSYGRYDSILTEGLFENCTYVVREDESEKYISSGVKNVLEIPSGEVSNGQDTFWWIVENTPEDIILIADDDISDIGYRTDTNVNLHRDSEIISSEVERIAQIMVDLNLGYGFITSTIVPYNYVSEFSFKGVCGSLKWVNKSAFKAKKDDDIKLNWDVDIVFQELLGNRITLVPNYIIGFDKADTNAGGETSGKKRQDQIDCIYNLKHKWGKYYSYNFEKNKPSIKVPR